MSAGITTAHDTIEAKLETGAYKNKLPYPVSPLKGGKDSEQDVAARDAYRAREREIYEEFKGDLTEYLKSKKVPDKYIEKVSSYCWEEGHAYGYGEVFAHATNVVEIFS